MAPPAGLLKKMVQPYPQLRDGRWGEIARPHEAVVMQELQESRPKDMVRALGVARGMRAQPDLDLGPDPIDWDKELAEFKALPYPEYYTKPFHSQLGGWLSPSAALNNRRAMETIYQKAHPRACTGLREELAKFVPDAARTVIDVGAGDGDGAAATARRLPSARVIAVEASPFMIIVGRRQNRGAAGVEWRHCLAEDTGLPAGCADAVTITLVLHECSDDAKGAIIREIFRLLRPGGTLVLSDTPPVNLQTYRGFYEPWKNQWLHFDADRFLAAAGFTGVRAFNLTPDGRNEQLFTRVAMKPAAGPRL